MSLGRQVKSVQVTWCNVLVMCEEYWFKMKGMSSNKHVARQAGWQGKWGESCSIFGPIIVGMTLKDFITDMSNKRFKVYGQPFSRKKVKLTNHKGQVLAPQWNSFSLMQDVLKMGDFKRKPYSNIVCLLAQMLQYSFKKSNIYHNSVSTYWSVRYVQ